ncbi:hypothetical protein BJ138DRAFT_1124914 [Hygrophoropsis aurantiaca]|uniref:Uncharacterized protein n=1 Tax=Hygrophoropsis aurantiaca TaxID=72124 RepID=A0ACB8AHJ5_9AGAM|nr:hypothetical protein BJ138DRAFT_1124914 [Hygrophoropsis aurantiaca]
MTDTSPLESGEEHLLQSALESAFEPADVPHAAQPQPPPSSTSPPPESTPQATSSSPAPPSEEDNWKAEYEAQVQEWRAQSAEARTKAENERARWEQIRKREAEEGHTRGEESSDSWELGSHITASFTAASDSLASIGSPSPADTRDLVTGEDHRPSHGLHEEHHARLESGSPSQKWEHLSSSQTSSFPSMSFPDPSGPPSPSHQRPAPYPALTEKHVREEQLAEPAPRPIPPSTIPSILDGQVACRTRLSLILSSLAINLFLPFVNGVMLGFGEIFAKNVIVGWIGWKSEARPKGSVASKLGFRR